MGTTDAPHRRSSSAHSSALPQPLAEKPPKAILLSLSKDALTCRPCQRFPDPEKLQGPRAPSFSGCGPGPRGTAYLLDRAHEYDSSWAFVRRGAAESSSLSRSESVPGVGQEWTSVPSTLPDTPRPLSWTFTQTGGHQGRTGKSTRRLQTLPPPCSRPPSHLRRSPVSWCHHNLRPGHRLPKRHLAF